MELPLPYKPKNVIFIQYQHYSKNTAKNSNIRLGISISYLLLTMATCSGNDYVFSICIGFKEVRIGRVHEKDEEWQNGTALVCCRTACVVDQHLRILKYDDIDKIMKDGWEKKVDNVNVFLIPCIVEGFYRASQLQEMERNERDIFIMNAFIVYMKLIIRNYVKKYESDINDVAHWVFTVSDDWEPEVIETLKLQLKKTGFNNIDHLMVIKYSHALIRYLQSRTLKHPFVNGSYYIVCHFKRRYNITIYGYEIGSYIKGLKNIMQHRLTFRKDVSVSLFEDYLLKELFDGDMEGVQRYNLDLNRLVECCFDKYNWWIEGRCTTLYDVIIQDQRYKLKHVSKSFAVDKREKLLSLELEIVIGHIVHLSSSYFDHVKEEIVDLSKSHFNSRVIMIDNTKFIFKKKMDQFLSLLPPDLYASFCTYDEYDNNVFLYGGAQVIQDALRIVNFLPQVKNRDALENISSNNMVYIDIGWHQNSLTCIDTNGKETYIKDISSIIIHSNPIRDCFGIHDSMHHSDLRNMNITDEFIHVLKQMPIPQPIKTRETPKKSISSLSSFISALSPTKKKKRMSIKQELLCNYILRNINDLQSKYKEVIPKYTQKALLLLYFQCLQYHIHQYLVDNLILTGPIQFYISADQSILDIFLINYEELRSKLLKLPIPQRLIHREQVAAVHFKDILKCYDKVEEYLDYPQYVVQVQMNQMHLNMALNAILTLDKEIKAASETVLTLKRKIIPFDMVDHITEHLWSHIQSTNLCPVSLCMDHTASDYENKIELYEEYTNHFKEYFINEFTISNKQGDIDWYSTINININSKCKCTLDISCIDLFDICILPAIKKVRSVIYSSTTDVCMFGEYKITHIVIMGTLMKLKSCQNTDQQVLKELKKDVEYHQKYYENINIQWYDGDIATLIYKGIRSIIQYPPGGLLEQIYAGSYKLRSSIPFYKDHQRLQLIPTHCVYSFINEGTRVTEDMRDNGASIPLYTDKDDINIGNVSQENEIRDAYMFYLGIYYVTYGENEESIKKIEGFYVRSIDSSYPVVIKVQPRISELKVLIQINADGAIRDNYRHIGKLALRENVLLSPFS
ncbi:hypothetical protein BDB01DRAFT_900242 [Pilobolus umbonatus]|nr:hypothetical protein BDB01DRAFT_900242 [Pilobolus umbonatus]